MAQECTAVYRDILGSINTFRFTYDLLSPNIVHRHRIVRSKPNLVQMNVDVTGTGTHWHLRGLREADIFRVAHSAAILIALVVSKAITRSVAEPSTPLVLAARGL